MDNNIIKGLVGLRTKALTLTLFHHESDREIAFHPVRNHKPSTLWLIELVEVIKLFQEFPRVAKTNFSHQGINREQSWGAEEEEERRERRKRTTTRVVG